MVVEPVNQPDRLYVTIHLDLPTNAYLLGVTTG